MKDIPAFPQTIDDMGTMRSVTEGMTLRDYFAGQAIIAIWIAAKEVTCITREDMVGEAFKVADAMLAEREK